MTDTTDTAPATEAAEAVPTKSYELMAILSGKLKDAEIPTTLAEVKKAFAKHGAKVTKEQLWGRLKFAYEIAHERAGTYALWQFDLEPSKVRALDAELRVTDHVLRFLLTDTPKHGATIEAPVQLPPRSDRERGERDGRPSREPREDRQPVAATAEASAPAKTAGDAAIDKTLDEILGEKT